MTSTRGDIVQTCLTFMREKINWGVEEERLKFLLYFHTLIENEEEVFLNLRDIFRQKEIEYLLFDTINSIDFWAEDENYSQICFIRFVARTSDYKDEPKVDKNGKPLLHRTTPVHQAVRLECYSLVDDLFKIYNRFDLNYTDEDGLTHFHAACASGCDDVVEKFLELGQDPNCLWQGDTPLHLAVGRRCKKVAQLLLENNADPNLADDYGWTPLHLFCRKSFYDDYEMAEMLFKFSDKHQPMLIDTRDKAGSTPLHSALISSRIKVSELLLKRGADPNASDEEGSTPLHIICKNLKNAVGLLIMFFKINLELNQLVHINARDKLGNTPLHCALGFEYREPTFVRELLRRGADPNIADSQGYTPLHIICMKKDREDMLKSFFQVTDEKKQLVQVDARDKLGRTPLQWAVVSLNPYMVDILLDRGADLSSFVFPARLHFVERFKQSLALPANFNMKLASHILLIVERLEKRGYKIDRSDAMTIMTLFAEYKVFKKSTDLEKFSFDAEFVSKSKKIMIKGKDSGLSLYDLIRLRHIETAKSFTCTDFYEFVRMNKLWQLTHWYEGAYAELCTSHLCEKMSKGFFLTWALAPFLELAYQLPILCCRKIIQLLTSEDLCNICLAVADQSSKST